MDLGLLNETHANEAGSGALSEIEAGGQLHAEASDSLVWPLINAMTLSHSS